MAKGRPQRRRQQHRLPPRVRLAAGHWLCRQDHRYLGSPQLEKPLHSLQAHRSDVIGLQWHPQDAAILASSSYDRRVLLWDTSKIGDEQTEEEAEDGPPELLFMHGGFTNRICDFDWNKNDPWVMMGAAEDNQLQIFRPARKLVEPVQQTVNHGEVSE